MSVWFALLLGLVQGMTEFLPVSSSAHLCLLQRLFPEAAGCSLLCRRRGWTVRWCL